LWTETGILIVAMAGLEQGITKPARRSDDGRSNTPEWAILWGFPELTGRLTSIRDAPLTLGRDPDCDVPLPGEQTSRRHAELRRSGYVMTVRDLGSTNGIFLNGARVTEAHLKTRDVLRVGEWIGVVVSVDPDDASDTLRGPLFQEVTPDYWAGPTLQVRLRHLARAAPSDLPVVVQGETGAGKEGVARSLHAWSGRQGPFLAVNCAALPESMAEGELFGYRKGAFTGAERANPGYLRAAHRGTLFLDEIVDLPLPIQAKLLRALEQREVIPLGEASPVQIDVRIVSAAQAPLSRAVADQRFRPDLFARLDGLTIEVPPLRERPDEVLFLFSRRLARHAGGGAVPEIDMMLAEQLVLYDWPFNVRELDLLARQMIALHGDVPILKRSHLPDRLRSRTSRPVAPLAAVGAHPRGEGPDIEAFTAALRANEGNVKRAAAALGISRAKAYRLMGAAGSAGNRGGSSDDER
jgi:transcriptional regulator with AAA-type ATPase domain